MDENSSKRTAGTRRTSRPPELRIVLDTNQLYTGSASDLLKAELAQLITDLARHKDLTLRWYIPDVVRLERRRQMLQAGRDLLGPVRKLERLLGHGLGIGDEVLVDRVNAAIEKQLQALGVTVLPLDPSCVDWMRLVDDSANRRPPFDPGKTEKGFRDAVIVETFAQLINASPKTAKVCRVVLVSADDLLVTAVEERAGNAANVRVLRALDELRDLVNTVVADVTEEFVSAIRSAAGPCFFTKSDDRSLYYSAKVRDRILADFAAELAAMPEHAEQRKNGTWSIGAPRFSHKKAQRVHWVSTIKVPAKAVRNDQTSDFSALSNAVFLTQSPFQYVPAGQVAIAGLGSPDSLYQPQFAGATLRDLTTRGSGISPFGSPTVARSREVTVAEGESLFEVLWSARVTAKKVLVNAKVDDIRHIETTWDTA